MTQCLEVIDSQARSDRTSSLYVTYLQAEKSG